MLPFSKITGTFNVLPLDMNRDYGEIDELLKQEEWPFIRADLQVSHDQPCSTGLVARSSEQLLGFFATHNFGAIGYLDMMIVAPHARVSRVAIKLYMGVTRQMKQKGTAGWVAHSTNDSYRMFKLMRYTQGQSFTLLARDPLASESNVGELDSLRLGTDDRDQLVKLDRDIFGMARFDWVNTLLGQPTTHFYGRKLADQLVASVCVRQRRGNSVCLDAVNTNSIQDLVPLLDQIVDGFAGKRIECFVKTDSDLHHYLLAKQFSVPEFFNEIGPLVEWRKGETGKIGTSDQVRSLAWF